MDRLTLDQTASERVLHRVLYVIKFLRAMVLHVLLAVLAAALFLLTGITGFYPVADNTIHALRAEAIVQRQQNGWLGEPLTYGVVLAVVVVAMLALLVWIYRSITAVRPRSLKFQALMIALATLSNVAQFWPHLRFAFDKLDRTFAVLATIGSGLGQFVFPMAVAVSLWQVARVPERSSLVATLDPRLAAGGWATLNKLLDLPRTPLQTGKTSAAYLLALVGAVILIASLMHLLTLGGVNNRLSVLAAGCDAEILAKCVALTSTWAWQIPLTLVVAVLGLKVAGWLQSRAKRLGGLSVSDVLKRPDDPFVLYLRPFDTDDVVLPTPKLPPWSSLFSFRPLAVRVEEELFDVADGHRPLIAVGKPGGADASGGVAYRAYLDDSAWQDYVADKIRRAERIVLVMKDSAGVRWEIERVIAEGATHKTLFLFDPAVTSATEWATLERMLAPLLQGADVADEAFAGAARRPIGFFFQRGTLVEIVNDNRSATSYRTAFSTFLAEDLGNSLPMQGSA